MFQIKEWCKDVDNGYVSPTLVEKIVEDERKESDAQQEKQSNLPLPSTSSCTTTTTTSPLAEDEDDSNYNISEQTVSTVSQSPISTDHIKQADVIMEDSFVVMDDAVFAREKTLNHICNQPIPTCVLDIFAIPQQEKCCDDVKDDYPMFTEQMQKPAIDDKMFSVSHELSNAMQILYDDDDWKNSLNAVQVGQLDLNSCCDADFAGVDDEFDADCDSSMLCAMVASLPKKFCLLASDVVEEYFQAS